MLTQGDPLAAVAAGAVGLCVGEVAGFLRERWVDHNLERYNAGVAKPLSLITNGDYGHITRVEQTHLLPDYPWGIRPLQHNCTDCRHEGQNEVTSDGLLVIGPYVTSQARRRELFCDALRVGDKSVAKIILDLSRNNEGGRNTDQIIGIVEARQKALRAMYALREEIRAAKARRDAHICLPKDNELLIDPGTLRTRLAEYRAWAEVDESWTPISNIDTRYANELRHVLGLTGDDPAVALGSLIDVTLGQYRHAHEYGDTAVIEVHNALRGAFMKLLKNGVADESCTGVTHAIGHAKTILTSLDSMTTLENTPADIYGAFYGTYHEIIPTLPHPDLLPVYR